MGSLPWTSMLRPTLLALFGALYASADLIIQKPLASKMGPEKLFIIINGAYVPNTDYAELGQKIQEASPLKLWIAIPSFALNCPNPGQINSKIKDAVSQVKGQGFANLTTSTDVFISGHSLGGIFSQTVVGAGGYAGLVLFGSYLSTVNKLSLKTFKYPVLTLGGELDGLTHITRIAQEFKAMEDRIAADGHAALYKFPVVVLPGQSHSQFCSNVNVTSFGNKDLMPDVSWDVAHAKIAEAVTNFLNLVITPGDASAQAYVDSNYNYTADLLSGWFAAQNEESSWCAYAQKLNAANVTSTFKVNTVSCSNFGSFDVTYPSVHKDSHSVQVVDELQHKLNPTDSSLVDISAQEIDCKMEREEAILKAFGETAVSGPQTCRAVNEAAITKAFSLVSAATRERYQRVGKPFAVQNDSKYSTGITWQSGSFGFSPDATQVKVQSPVLFTGDIFLCKLLSPSRIVEYMMTDGLPRFDGSVP